LRAISNNLLPDLAEPANAEIASADNYRILRQPAGCVNNRRRRQPPAAFTQQMNGRSRMSGRSGKITTFSADAIFRVILQTFLKLAFSFLKPPLSNYLYIQPPSPHTTHSNMPAV